MSGDSDSDRVEQPELTPDQMQRVAEVVHELFWSAIALVAVDAELDDPGEMSVEVGASVPAGVCEVNLNLDKMQNQRAVNVARATAMLVNHQLKTAWPDVTEDGVSGVDWVGWFDTVATFRVHGALSLVREGGAWLSARKQMDLTEARCRFIGLILGDDDPTGGDTGGA